ncbi:DUF1844 domain-containing protein [bacterium]|nr:DUF1844 domain-containing protein [bacterium]
MNEQVKYHDLLFINLIKTFELSANVSLGLIEDPVSKSKKMDLQQAKYYIDLLEMLKARTKKNNSDEIERYLKEMILQLQMKYIELTSNNTDKKGEI